MQITDPSVAAISVKTVRPVSHGTTWNTSLARGEQCLEQPLYAMDIQEEALRRIIASPDGHAFGQSLLDAIDQGEIVIIAKPDRRTLTLSEVHMARRTLRDVFDWTPYATIPSSPLRAQAA